MEAKSERRARESDLKLHETVATLQTHFSGVRGVLSDLSSIMNPKWSVAVATALGRHLDSVVVDEERTALECISYLKEQRLPPVTFIPLNTIKVKQTNESLRGLKANHFLLAIDCVSFEEALERAFLYALGDTLICVSEQVRTAHTELAPFVSAAPALSLSLSVAQLSHFALLVVYRRVRTMRSSVAASCPRAIRPSTRSSRWQAQ